MSKSVTDPFAARWPEKVMVAVVQLSVCCVVSALAAWVVVGATLAIVEMLS